MPELLKQPVAGFDAAAISSKFSRPKLHELESRNRSPQCTSRRLKLGLRNLLPVTPGSLEMPGAGSRPPCVLIGFHPGQPWSQGLRRSVSRLLVFLPPYWNAVEARVFVVLQLSLASSCTVWGRPHRTLEIGQEGKLRVLFPRIRILNLVLTHRY